MATMAKNKSSSSSSVCHHSPPASPPTMVEDFGSLSLGYFSFSRPPWPYTLSRLSLSLLSHRSSKAPSPELELPHGLILTLTEVLDLAKAPSSELKLLHGLILTLTPRFSIWPRLPHRSSTATMAIDKSSQALTLSFLWLQTSRV
uniref:Uncharacterized protein n=1 Tax=Fagus sylvatica TaxID=28930 RepID=A0A2N9F7N1_FAGSY